MLEVADIVRLHGAAYRERFGKTPSSVQKRALRDIAACRTPFFGATSTSAITASRTSLCFTPVAIALAQSVTKIKPTAGLKNNAATSRPTLYRNSPTIAGRSYPGLQRDLRNNQSRLSRAHSCAP